MVSWSAIVGIAAVALGMVLIPGPNMFYLVSRAIAQGRRAGAVSLLGVALGFAVYLAAAVVGLTAVFALVPTAYTALKIAGGCYLLYLAWQAFRPGGKSPFTPQPLKPASNGRLFTMGLVTNLLNPKVAILYVSLLPQFIEPARGSVAVQSLILGGVQIGIGLAIDGIIMVCAASLSGFFVKRPVWLRAQRAVFGSVLAVFAVKLVLDPSRAAAS